MKIWLLALFGVLFLGPLGLICTPERRGGPAGRFPADDGLGHFAGQTLYKRFILFHTALLLFEISIQRRRAPYCTPNPQWETNSMAATAPTEKETQFARGKSNGKRRHPSKTTANSRTRSLGRMAASSSAERCRLALLAGARQKIRKALTARTALLTQCEVTRPAKERAITMVVKEARKQPPEVLA